MKRIPQAFSGPGNANLDGRSTCNRPSAVPAGIYLGCSDGGLYFYDKKWDTVKLIAKANEAVTCIAELGGTVYFGSGGRLSSYSPATGVQALTQFAEERLTCATGIGGVLYFSGYGGNLYSYNPATKKGKKLAEFGGRIFCIEELEGVLYAGGTDSVLYSYDPVTRETKTAAKAETKTSTIFCMAKNDGIMYFGSWDCSLYSYDPFSKEQQTVAMAPGQRGYLQKGNGPSKKTTLRDPIRCAVCLDGRIFFGTSNGEFCSYDENKRTRKRKTAIKLDGPIGDAAKLGDEIYLNLGYSNTPAKLHSYQPKRKKHRLVAELDSAIECAIGVEGGAK